MATLGWEEADHSSSSSGKWGLELQASTRRAVTAEPVWFGWQMITNHSRGKNSSESMGLLRGWTLVPASSGMRDCPQEGAPM